MISLPSSSVVFKGLLTINVASVIWNIIADCDETYNYWEPLHFLIYGSGFQTWEYSPEFALRSYAYLWIHGAIGKCLALLHMPKSLVFYAIRLQCGLMMSLCQLYLYSAMKRRLNDHFHVMLTIFVSAFSSGSFISSSAFLPSSFAMYCSYICLGAWLDKKYKIAIFAVAVSAIMGWPFSVALALPLAVDILFVQRKVFFFFACSVACGSMITLPMVVIDSFYFGKLVIAPLNILHYNVFSPHGSELYGTETFMFYIRNYFLNFNIATLLAFSLPSLAVASYVARRDLYRLKLTLYAAPFFVWNIIFFMQPHKEERFLFPCYPFLCFAVGLAVSVVASWCTMLSKQTKAFLFLRHCFVGGFSLVFLGLSVSRVFLLLVGFRAPFTVFNQLSTHDSLSSHVGQTVVCIGKEWYRFPSHFFLKPHMELYFMKSGFKGQLPAKFSGPDGQLMSRVVHQHFNEMNREEPSRYVNVSRCDFIVDKDDVGEPNPEMRYPNYRTDYKTQFLDNEHSKGAFKSFYIPLLYHRKNVFVEYRLLKRFPGNFV